MDLILVFVIVLATWKATTKALDLLLGGNDDSSL